MMFENDKEQALVVAGFFYVRLATVWLEIL